MSWVDILVVYLPIVAAALGTGFFADWMRRRDLDRMKAELARKELAIWILKTELGRMYERNRREG